MDCSNGLKTYLNNSIRVKKNDKIVYYFVWFKA